MSRITIEVLCDDQQIEQITNQLRKQFTVYSVRLLPPELIYPAGAGASFKVKAESREVRNEVIQIANIFRASIIDVSTSTLTLAIIGEESKDNALEKLLEEFGILELVRTGMVALERGRATISDNEDNKETGEFVLGKNLL